MERGVPRRILCALAFAVLTVAVPGSANDASQLAVQEVALRQSFSTFKSRYDCVENPSFGDVWNGLWKASYVPGKFVCRNKKGETGYNSAAPEQVIGKKKGICVDLEKAPFTGADLVEASLSCADLAGADLNGAKLMLAELSGADLRGADLTGANLRGAVLLGADLSGLDLSRTSLEGAVANQYTKLPFGRAEALKRGLVFR